jgi:hypothetical protein
MHRVPTRFRRAIHDRPYIFCGSFSKNKKLRHMTAAFFIASEINVGCRKGTEPGGTQWCNDYCPAFSHAIIRGDSPLISKP